MALDIRPKGKLDLRPKKETSKEAEEKSKGFMGYLKEFGGPTKKTTVRNLAQILRVHPMTKLMTGDFTPKPFTSTEKAESVVRGGVKGGTLGYLDLPGEKNLPAELVGSFLPYMAAGPIGGGLRATKGTGLLARLARVAGAAVPMATVGAAKPAKDLKTRAKQAAFEGAIGGGFQAAGEVGEVAAPYVKKGTIWTLSKTTGIPEEQMGLAVRQTVETFKHKGNQVWEELAQRLKKGNAVLQKKAGTEVQEAIANSPKLSKVGYDYNQTLDDILQMVAKREQSWLGGNRWQAGERETLQKLYTMLKDPAGRFGNQLSFQKLHQAKKLLQDNISFAQAGRINPAPTEGEKLLGGVHKYILKQLGRDAKKVPEVANYVKANKFYSLYKDKLTSIKTLIEDKGMNLPDKLKALARKSKELQQAVKTFDRLLPKEFRVRKGLKFAQAAKEFEPEIRKGTALASLLGAGGLGFTAVKSPLLAGGLGIAGATTSPLLTGTGLRAGAALTRGVKKLPPRSAAIIPILREMIRKEK